MYRNVYYYVDNNDKYTGKIKLTSWDENGKRISYETEHSSTLLTIDHRGSYKSLYDEPLTKLNFKNVYERRTWIDKNQDAKIYGCYQPKMEFLHKVFKDQNRDLDNFTKYPLRIAFIDIEIAIEDIFPNAKDALFPINLITFYDTFTEKYYAYALGVCTTTRDDVVLKCFSSESQLLTEFLTDFKLFEFDVISGWNSYMFDIPYIYNRLVRVFSEEFARTLSPVNDVHQNKVILHGDVMDYEGLVIEGISHLDYLLLYKRFVTPMEGAKASYSLDYTCKEELGEGKLGYDKDLKHLYTHNFQRFFEYNIRDVELLVKLDKKRKFISHVRILCSISLIEYEKIFVASATVTGAIIQFSRDRNIELPFLKKSAESNETAEGAFVKDPIKGAYKNGVTSFDVQSLYPNIMIGLNISPETYIGKVVSTGDKRQIKANNKYIDINEEQYESLKNKYCVAANGAIYTRAKTGIVPLFLKEFFAIRLKLKNEVKDLKKQINILKKDKNADKAQIEALKLKSERLDLEQLTRKIILNTVYGICGNKHSIFFNIDNTEATTLTGQFIIKNASDFLDKCMKEDYQGTLDTYVIYNDTDSIYLNIEPVISKLFNKSFEDIPAISKELDKITNKLNKWCITELSHNLLNMYDKERINFSRDNICDKAYFFVKKRYILHIIEEEGIKIDKVKYKGVSIVRSTYPKFMHNNMKEIIEATIKENWTEKDFHNRMDKLYDDFCKRPITDIAFNVKMNSYKESGEFLKPIKGSTGPGKAALFYNQLLDELNLKSKYDYIKSGNMRTCDILKHNKYGISIIGFGEEYPDEFTKLFEPDRMSMFTKLFLSPLEDFCNCNGWKMWNGLREDVIDITNL